MRHTVNGSPYLWDPVAPGAPLALGAPAVRAAPAGWHLGSLEYPESLEDLEDQGGPVGQGGLEAYGADPSSSPCLGTATDTKDETLCTSLVKVQDKGDSQVLIDRCLHTFNLPHYTRAPMYQ